MNVKALCTAAFWEIQWQGNEYLYLGGCCHIEHILRAEWMRSFKRLVFETGLSSGFGEFPDLSWSHSNIMKWQTTSKKITLALNVFLLEVAVALVLLFSVFCILTKKWISFCLFRGLLKDTTKDVIRRTIHTQFLHTLGGAIIDNFYFH